ncbi:MAG: transposase [Phycisphaerales bacterium]
MARNARQQPGGVVFHVLNRGNERREIFADDADYAAFMRVMAQAMQQHSMTLLAYCLMPDHWHLVLRPRRDGDMGRFMQRLTVTHVRRWREHHHAVGLGHLYQGSYKSFPVQKDGHFLTVCRYVERNALRTNLVTRAEDWRWCSLWQRLHAAEIRHEKEYVALTDWPVDRPRRWRDRINQPHSEEEVEALRLSVNRGRPYGAEAWTAAIAKRLGLTNTLRPRGRPRQQEPK